MKRILLSAILACVMWASSAQDISNLRMSRADLGLRGNVVAVDEDHLYKKDYFRDDWITRGWFRKDLREFLQEEEGHIYTFTDNGNLEQVTYTYQGVQKATTRCGYAKNGLMTSFYGEGYKIEGKYTETSGELNVYAKQRNYGRGVDVTTGDLNSGYKIDYPFQYKLRQQISEDALVLKSTYFNVDSTLAREVEYTYGFNGRVVQETDRNYRSDGTAETIVISYTYDGNGLLTHKSVKAPAYNEDYTYTNNAMGDCIEMLLQRPFGNETYHYQYEYDSNGNWTIRLTSKDGIFESATIRTLTYGKGGKDKSGKAEKAVTEDGDAYYDTYDATAAHKDAVAANRAKRKERRKQEAAAKERNVKDNAAKAMEEAAAQQEKSARQQEAAKAKEKAASADEKADKNDSKVISRREAKKVARKNARTAEKYVKKQKKADEKAMRKEAKRVEKEARMTARNKAKARAKEEKKAAIQAAKEREKAAKQAAKDKEKADRKAAEDATKQAKQEAAAAEKEAVRIAKEQAKAKKEADEAAAKEVEKLAKQQAKEEAKKAKAEAKAAAKAAKKAAKVAEKKARKAAKKI